MWLDNIDDSFCFRWQRKQKESSILSNHIHSDHGKASGGEGIPPPPFDGAPPPPPLPVFKVIDPTKLNIKKQGENSLEKMDAERDPVRAQMIFLIDEIKKGVKLKAKGSTPQPAPASPSDSPKMPVLKKTPVTRQDSNVPFLKTNEGPANRSEEQKKTDPSPKQEATMVDKPEAPNEAATPVQEQPVQPASSTPAVSPSKQEEEPVEPSQPQGENPRADQLLNVKKTLKRTTTIASSFFQELTQSLGILPRILKEPKNTLKMSSQQANLEVGYKQTKLTLYRVRHAFEFTG